MIFSVSILYSGMTSRDVRKSIAEILMGLSECVKVSWINTSIIQARSTIENLFAELNVEIYHSALLKWTVACASSPDKPQTFNFDFSNFQTVFRLEVGALAE